MFEAEFKQRVFAASPSIYRQMFGEDESEQYLDPSEVKNVVPQSDEEFQAMMKELKGFGIGL
jgi:hypothetical protein